MFVDRIHIKVSAGGGGNGCIAFRREAYVPRGGPNGGDGGNGGDVVFVATSKVSSLLDLRFHAHWKAERGEHGLGKDCHGRNGKSAEIRVPRGTLVKDYETQEAIADLVEEGQRFCAAKGGRGGRGNARFLSSTNRAPRFAEKGEPGEERDYLLELKIIAEIGIVGLPNAGKSTLLSVVSAARPKIDNYPFTTLSPNLGVAYLPDHRMLTIADIPGIIEGAAQGKGLGHDFLRHIERTKVLLFLIDLGDPDPVHTYTILEKELAEHSNAFAKRPRVVALNKADVSENRERFAQIAGAFDDPFLVSGATGENVPELLERLWQLTELVRNQPEDTVIALPEREYRFEAPFTIEEVPGGYRVEGKRILQLVRMTDFENDEGVRHLELVLQRMGVFRALKRLGAADGQTVVIGDVELEYHAD